MRFARRPISRRGALRAADPANAQAPMAGRLRFEQLPGFSVVEAVDYRTRRSLSLVAGFLLGRHRLLLYRPRGVRRGEGRRKADEGQEYQDRKEAIDERTPPVQVHGRAHLRLVFASSSGATPSGTACERGRPAAGLSRAISSGSKPLPGCRQ